MFSVTQLVGSRSRIGGIPASPMSILPDSPSPREPSLVPGKMEAGCALVRQKELEEKTVLPHPPIQASVPSQALKTGTPAPLICGTADATVLQMLPDGSQTPTPQPRLPYPAGTLGRKAPSQLPSCHCLLQTTISICAMQLPFSSPGPGLTWSSHRSDLGGRGVITTHKTLN